MLRNNVSLQHLSVSGCSEFRELPPSLYDLHSLKSLRIVHCTNFSSFPVPSGENYLTSLQSLQLFDCDGLTSLPSGVLEHCRSLESLVVIYCNNLLSLPLHVWEMPSLSYLGLSGCPKLISVPSGGLHRLTGLRALEIGPFSEMVDFEAFQLIFNGIQQLLSLHNVGVTGRGHWDSLPYQLMQLSSLTHIHICDFGIEALPHRFSNLTSLETLMLVRCKRLQHLDFSDVMPKLQYLCGHAIVHYLCNCEKLEHLPSRDAMRHLTKLQSLKIKGCPKLEESCNNRSGPNSQWSNISHIPKVKVGRSIIQDLLPRSCLNLVEHHCGKSSQNPQVAGNYLSSKVFLERRCGISSQNPWLLSLTIKEINSSRDFNEDLEMFTQNVSLIQAFLHDVETPQVEKQQSVEQWLRRLERVAENVFDRFRYESLKTKVMNIRNSPMKKVSGFFSHTAFKRKMSRIINSINKELTAINKAAKDLGLHSLIVPSRKILPIRETDSIVVASDVVGRDLDVSEIKG
ncbi:hypothetical protein H5410_053276 [Solanum commersonii]|uniref:Disease resistance N-terminal domain-containing protein n=1 Tax=Solanum commersonii TaxID=4109 RepID=A0A9J5X329_SOLCO|nr:hypothetical protein H5410_053276 [Solanum commersonii]